MSPYSIRLIDNRADLCQNPRHNRNVVRGLTISVRWSLMADYRRQEEEAETDIRVCLDPSTRGVEPCGVCTILKRWYWDASARAPNTYRTDMEKVREELQTFYHREETHPPGLTLDTHVNLSKVNGEIRSEAEVEVAVRRLHPQRAGGHTQLRAEHFEQWQQEAYHGKQSKTPLQRERRMCLVDLV